MKNIKEKQVEKILRRNKEGNELCKKIEKFMKKYGKLYKHGVKGQTLCYRCEHRAMFFEEGDRPRFQCDKVLGSVTSCYMFMPVQPLVLKREKGDKRAMFASWPIGSRMNPVSVADCNARLTKEKKGYVVYWEPKSKNQRTT